MEKIKISLVKEQVIEALAKGLKFKKEDYKNHFSIFTEGGRDGGLLKLAVTPKNGSATKSLKDLIGIISKIPGVTADKPSDRGVIICSSNNKSVWIIDEKLQNGPDEETPEGSPEDYVLELDREIIPDDVEQAEPADSSVVIPMWNMENPTKILAIPDGLTYEERAAYIKQLLEEISSIFKDSPLPASYADKVATATYDTFVENSVVTHTLTFEGGVPVSKSLTKNDFMALVKKGIEKVSKKRISKKSGQE